MLKIFEKYIVRYGNAYVPLSYIVVSLYFRRLLRSGGSIQDFSLVSAVALRHFGNKPCWIHLYLMCQCYPKILFQYKEMAGR